MFKPKTILLPIDLELDGFEAVLFALGVAKQFEAELHFFYVNSPQAGYRSPTIQVEELRAKVEAHAGSNALRRVHVHYAVSKGDIGEEIKKYSKEQGIELLITTHKHHSRLFSELFDTRDEIIIDSIEDVPVLVVPKHLLELGKV